MKFINVGHSLFELVISVVTGGVVGLSVRTVTLSFSTLTF